jgi:hypothetical protein
VAGELFQGALIHTLLCLQFLHFWQSDHKKLGSQQTTFSYGIHSFIIVITKSHTKPFHLIFLNIISYEQFYNKLLSSPCHSVKCLKCLVYSFHATSSVHLDHLLLITLIILGECWSI